MKIINRKFICNVILLLMNLILALVAATWFVKVLPEEHAEGDLLCFGLIALSSTIGIVGACIRIHEDRKR